MVNKFPTFFFFSSIIKSSLLCVESLRVSKDIRVLGLQEVLFLNTVISEFLLMVTR
jgi:hypothetical protein